MEKNTNQEEVEVGLVSNNDMEKNDQETVVTGSLEEPADVVRSIKELTLVVDTAVQAWCLITTCIFQ
ncbi:hypothetical protein A2U01_0046799 [Trifolium medium]|uniref:Uncharacterized protein n=1 Tax=Trifolium medium TaxID=97028 RepID=A0A392QMZ9_9FABA|nr:hypothetical protein [Trifolium medium]